MLSNGVLKMLERVDANALASASKAVAAAELRRRLENEGVSHSCLRCDDALWAVSWGPTPGAPFHDYKHTLLVCRSLAVLPADVTGMGLQTPPIPFFCCGERGVSSDQEYQNGL